MDVPCACVLKLMLRYGTSSRKLLRVNIGSRVGGCVSVPCAACVLKMMLCSGMLHGWISGQLKVEGHGVPDRALSDLVFQFFF